MNRLRRLPGWQQDGLAILTLCFFLAAVVLVLLELRTATVEARDRADNLAQSLPRVERAIAAGPELENRLTLLKKGAGEASGLLSASSTNLAGAELQRRLNSIIESKGGRVDSSQVLAAAEEGSFQRITVRLNAALDIAQLQATLFQIETGEPLLFIEELSAQPVRRGRGQQAPNQRPALQVTLTVLGYIGSLGESGDG